MHRCVRCGGSLRRIHRTFFERLGYMAIYQCHRCQIEQMVARRWRYHIGPVPRCPKCGTLRIARLKSRDKIDPMVGGFLNLVERLVNGGLYHCKFCRIQFYDRRPVLAAPSSGEVSLEPVESAPRVA